MKTLKSYLKNRHLFAYLQGAYERFRYGDSFGRTHETDQEWNEAYDSGANFIDFIRQSNR